MVQSCPAALVYTMSIEAIWHVLSYAEQPFIPYPYLHCQVLLRECEKHNHVHKHRFCMLRLIDAQFACRERCSNTGQRVLRRQQAEDFGLGSAGRIAWAMLIIRLVQLHELAHRAPVAHRGSVIFIALDLYGWLRLATCWAGSRHTCQTDWCTVTMCPVLSAIDSSQHCSRNG